jgi:hypothetical protein
MPDFEFSPRYGLKPIRNPDLETLTDLILDANRHDREYGEAGIRFIGGVPPAWLFVLHDRHLGCSLWFDEGDGETWVPVGDATRMSELACPDDIKSPVGSFLPPAVALEAILEFCRTATPLASLKWVRMRDLAIPDAAWES